MQFKIEKQGKGWPLHIVLDEKSIKKLLVDGNKRAIATEKISKESFHCAINLNKQIGYYVYIKASLSKMLKLKEGNTIDLNFVIDTTEHQFEMPEEMQEVLVQDDAAKKIFDSLTNGKKRGLLYLVTMVKSTDKKIEKALLIAEKLKVGITDARLMLKK
jgi:Bacteriocin-protection, YdeI or OmpD-Associated